MIELSLDTLALDAEAPPTEALDNGAPPVIHCQVVGGNDLPFADPRDPNRPLRIPGLVVNWQMTKKAALEYAERLKEQAEKLPDDKPSSSKLAIASSMSDVDKVAQFDSKLR